MFNFSYLITYQIVLKFYEHLWSWYSNIYWYTIQKIFKINYFSKRDAPVLTNILFIYLFTYLFFFIFFSQI